MTTKRYLVLVPALVFFAVGMSYGDNKEPGASELVEELNMRLEVLERKLEQLEEQAEEYIARSKEISDSEVIRSSESKNTTESSVNNGQWVVRIGAFTKRENVDAVVDVLNKGGLKPQQSQVQTASGIATRLWLGPYETQQSADMVNVRLEKLLGDRGYVLRQANYGADKTMESKPKQDIDTERREEKELADLKRIKEEEKSMSDTNSNETTIQQDVQTEREATEAMMSAVGGIASKVEENWRTPLNVKSGLTANIRITVAPNGEVLTTNIVETSGDERFDRSALVSVNKASPLPIPANPDYYDYIKEFEFRFNPHEELLEKQDGKEAELREIKEPSGFTQEKEEKEDEEERK